MSRGDMVKGRPSRLLPGGTSSAIVAVVLLLVIASTIVALAVFNNPAAGPTAGMSRYVIGFKDMPQAELQQAKETVEDLIQANNGEVISEYTIINGIAAEVPENLVGTLAGMPGVKYVEEERPLYLQLDNAAIQLGVKSGPGVQPSWTVWDGTWTKEDPIPLDGTGITVCVLDSGMDPSHPDLAGKIIGWKNFVVGDENNPVCYDDNDHGTFIASEISGSGVSSDPPIPLTGIDDTLYGGPFKGMAPGAKLYSAKVVGQDMTSSSIPFLNGLQWAHDIQPDIVSISMAGVHSEAFDEAVKSLYDDGIVVVVAAGNTGPGTSSIMCPGDSPYVITVGAVYKNDTVAWFSSRGPTDTGLVKPDVVTTGVDIIGAKVVTEAPDNFTAYYRTWQGTSMATPEVSGIVALMQQYAKSLDSYSHKMMSPDQVKYVLTHTARQPPGAGDDYVTGFTYGYGIANATRALTYMKTGKDPNFPPEPAAPKGSVWFEEANYLVDEDVSELQVKVKADVSQPFSISYEAQSNSAIAGKDYDVAPGTLSFDQNNEEGTITVYVHNNYIPASTRDFFLKITSADNALVTQGSAKVTIQDVHNQVVTFDVSGYTVTEKCGQFPVTIKVDRTGVPEEVRKPVTVSYKTIDGTAIAGQSYSQATGSHTFGDSSGVYADVDTFSFDVTVNPNFWSNEQMKYFFVQLFNPENATLGSPNTDRAWILYSTHMDTGMPSTVCTLYPATPSNPATGWYNTEVQVTLVATDDKSGVGYVEYSVNGGDWVKTSGATASFEVSSEGTNLVEYRAADYANNVEASKSVEIKIDTTPPVLDPISTTPPGPIYANVDGTKVDVSCSCPELCSQLKNGEATAMWNWGDGTPNTAGIVSGDLITGTHTYAYTGATIDAEIYLNAVDKAGNPASAGPAEVTIYEIDPPNTALTLSGQPSSYGWYNRTVQATLTATDNAGGSGVDFIRYKLNDGAWVKYSGSADPVVTTVDVTGEGANTLKYNATDKEGNFEDVKTATIKIDKTAPALGDINAPVDPILATAGGTRVDVSCPCSETLSGIATAMWNWGDGTPETAGVVLDGQITGWHIYYGTDIVVDITLNVTDKAGNLASVTSAPVTIYTPTGTYVTGGGHINSPPGAYPANPSLTGDNTNFGLVAKILNKKLQGNTEFQFKPANLNFKSTSYKSLVITGAKAVYYGTGTINGAGKYGFMVSAIDGQLSGGGGVDKFRIKIWDASTNVVIYDNEIGKAESADPTTPVLGGSISIKK